MKQIVITGIGMITPAGSSMADIWQQVSSGAACTRRIDRFDASRYLCQVAGQADSFVGDEAIPKRLAKRTDRFTHMALAAAEAALADARLEIGVGVAPERAGVTVGNILGGWEFAERELRQFWREGTQAVSPYQATAWFPAAPQGNICIKFGIKGYARTLIADRASGAYALIHGAELIRRGHADVVLAGGTEAPLSPYGWLCCQTSGYQSRAGNDRPSQAYRPFDRGHRGSILGEGSAFLVLEELEHALQRDATIYGELRGWAISTDGYQPYYTTHPSGDVLAKSIQTSLSRAQLGAGDINAIFPHASAVPQEDATDVMAIKSAFKDTWQHLPIAAPKSALGHLMGAAAPLDVILALQAMRTRQIPPIANLDQPAVGFDLDFVHTTPRAVERCDHSLVMSRGLGGINACMILARQPAPLLPAA